MTDPLGTVVVGTVTQDYIENADGSLIEGELGGSATYFALTARHFGPVSVIAAVGRDREADLREMLHFADLSRLTVTPAETMTWKARRPEAGGDALTLSKFEGAYRGYRPDLSEREELPRGVFLGSCAPDVQLAVAERAAPGAILGADSMDVFIGQRDFHKVLRRVSFLLLTAHELQLLSRARGVGAGAEQVLQEYDLRALVVKRGAAGAILFSREASERLAAFPVEAPDPTGAGDALAGAFMGRLMELGNLSHEALVECLQWGVVASSFAVAAQGTRGLRDITRVELEKRLDEYLEGKP